jgi:hypothetical protein
LLLLGLPGCENVCLEFVPPKLLGLDFAGDEGDDEDAGCCVSRKPGGSGGPNATFGLYTFFDFFLDDAKPDSEPEQELERSKLALFEEVSGVRCSLSDALRLVDVLLLLLEVNAERSADGGAAVAKAVVGAAVDDRGAVQGFVSVLETTRGAPAVAGGFSDCLYRPAPRRLFALLAMENLTPVFCLEARQTTPHTQTHK